MFNFVRSEKDKFSILFRQEWQISSEQSVLHVSVMTYETFKVIHSSSCYFSTVRSWCPATEVSWSVLLHVIPNIHQKQKIAYGVFIVKYAMLLIVSPMAWTSAVTRSVGIKSSTCNFTRLRIGRIFHRRAAGSVQCRSWFSSTAHIFPCLVPRTYVMVT